MLDLIAQRYTKKVVKNEMRKISKIFYNAILKAYEDGWLDRGRAEDEDFCTKKCKLWNTEYRCRECTRNEFDG